jgi:hypothetical protein
MMMVVVMMIVAGSIADTVGRQANPTIQTVVTSQSLSAVRTIADAPYGVGGFACGRLMIRMTGRMKVGPAGWMVFAMMSAVVMLAGVMIAGVVLAAMVISAVMSAACMAAATVAASACMTAAAMSAATAVGKSRHRQGKRGCDGGEQHRFVHGSAFRLEVFRTRTH